MVHKPEAIRYKYVYYRFVLFKLSFENKVWVQLN